MKHFLFLSLLLSSIYSFGQITDSTALKKIKTYHDELSTLLKDYQKLTMEEKKTTKNQCDEASSFFRYIKSSSSIAADTLAKYDILTLCAKFKALEQLAALTLTQNELQKLKDELDKTLDTLKSSKLEESERLVKSVSELKTAIYTQCINATELLSEAKKQASIEEGTLGVFDFGSCEDPNKNTEPKTKKYIIVGDGDPIDAGELFKQGTAQEFFHEIIGSETNTQLGTFEIPSENIKIPLYVETNLKATQLNFRDFERRYISVEDYLTEHKFKGNDNVYNLEKGLGKNIDAIPGAEEMKKISGKIGLPKNVLFHSIGFEMKDGGLVDIRLEAFDTGKKIRMYFESRAPVSLLKYTRASSRSFLHFSNTFNDEKENPFWDYSILKYLRIRISDILKYKPEVGNNYVPDDLALNLPKDMDKEEGENSIRSYKLINDSSLKNILDLRTYTDFLGLFGDESNGLFQVEGKADFFLNPFNFNRTSLYILQKATPFIRYSRLEEDRSFIQLATLDKTAFDEKRLELIERSNLEIGLDFNLAKFRFFKESPVWVSFHVPINLYNSKVRLPDTENNGGTENDENQADDDSSEDDINFNTVGYGAGMSWEVNRLRNFGLNLGAYFKWYSYIGDYGTYNLVEPDTFKTYSLEAEVFYYPGESEGQSIFLRMRTFRDIAHGDSAFQQIQFGYRFTLGAGNVKAKK